MTRTSAARDRTAAARDRTAPARDRTAALEHSLFLVLPALLLGVVLRDMVAHGLVAVDFRREYWVAGARVLHGTSPYAWSHAQIAAGVSFPYPALAALLFVPFGLLPVAVSEALFTAVCIAAAVLTLRVLNVRDWRLYGLVLMWSPVIAVVQTGNLTLLLALGLALLWVNRDRPVAAGALVALLVSLKPFTWPLGVWLIATRRYRAAGWALASGLVLNAVAWSVVGVGRLSQFVTLSGQVTDALAKDGYGVIAVAMHLGAGRGTGELLEGALSLALALACVAAGRRGREREALALATGLMLAASPLVWNHYLALLIVPLALARPRLAWPWAAGIVLWLCPSDGVATWQSLLAWALSGATIAVLVLPAAPAIGSLRPRLPGGAAVTGGGAP